MTEISRRTFLKGLGAGAAVAAVPGVLLKRMTREEFVAAPDWEKYTFHSVTGDPIVGVDFTGDTPALVQGYTFQDSNFPGLPITPSGGDITVYFNKEGWAL